MFKSIYSDILSQYYCLRSESLSDSARKHELCYLKRFDAYVYDRLSSNGSLSETFISGWVRSLSGKSSSVENEVIVIRQFLSYLSLCGEHAFIPPVPKVHEDYIPYIFSDTELEEIFTSADNVIQKDFKTDPYLVIEFPVVIRLLYSCGLRIGETLRIDMEDVDLENGILRLLNTKGNKHRIVPMSSAMTDILTLYCMAMGIYGTNTGWLFPSFKSDDHISDRAIKRRFEMVLKNNGIHLENRKKYERGPCLHCMRHVFAFKSFAQAERCGRHLDDTIPFLSIYLGHESINETSKYLKFSNELYPEAIEAFGSYMRGLVPEVDYET
ncbi:Site-specific recombinase XerD [Lachnospiraceae bacterium A10]|nr:Site-specific recombinase XerD [Lachnospiraceae bacterium A10]SEI90584.1 Site-specific recombinase XerD [Lachnospiraceae bacterium A10]